MSAPEEIVAGYQWLAIPHGIEDGKLKITIRVIPLLYKRYFKARGDEPLHLSDLDFAGLGTATDAVMDWPRFVGAIKGFRLGFAPVDAPSGDFKTHEAKIVPEGGEDGLRSDIWRALFGPGIRVIPEEEPGTDEFQVTPKTTRAKLLSPMPHADGANVLRAEIGRAHVQGILDFRETGDFVRRRAGVVESRFRIDHGGAVATLAQAMAAPDVPRAEFIRQINRLGTQVSTFVQRDYDRMYAVLPRGLFSARKNVPALIKSWNDSSLISTLEPGTADSLSEFLLHRSFALAPDLPSATAAQKFAEREDAGVSVRSTQRDESQEQDLPEFHRDLGKTTSHSWLMRILGLTIQVRIEVPADWTGTGALYVHEVEHEYFTFKPRVQIRIITEAGADIDKSWHPAPTRNSQYSCGCVRLGDLETFGNGAQPTPAFALEQLDVDSAAEKLLHVIQTLSSQFDAGVVADRREATLSTLRTTGMSLLMRNAAGVADKARQQLCKRRGQSQERRCVDLYADDLIIGLRPDICSMAPNLRGGSCVEKWKSLNRRKLIGLKIDGKSFAFKKAQEDESFVTPHGRLVDVIEGIEPDDSRRLPFEEMFCWRGWSLGVPQVETMERRRDAPDYIPEITYRSNGGLPLQRFGWGYLVGARAVYVDGSSLTLDEAIQRYSRDKEKLTLGTPKVGASMAPLPLDPNRYFAPFLRYEAVQPAKVSATTTSLGRKSSEREERMLVTSDGHGRVIQRESRRELSAPQVELECAIRAGMYDSPAARRNPPNAGFVPDPWATRMIIGIYRKADGELLHMEYFDYYDDEHLWPNARTLGIRLIAETSASLPAQGFLTTWVGDTYTVRIAAGATLEIRHWHEMSKEQLAASGVIEAMARWLTADPRDAAERERIARARKDLRVDSICTDFCDMRDQLIKVLAQWHENFPFDLRPYLAAGRQARDVALTSFSMLNPAGILELSHATPIPVRDPVFSEADPRVNRRRALLPMVASEVARRFNIQRETRGSTVAEFVGDIEIHRASTERVECFGQWEDVIDDPSKKRETRTQQTHPLFRIENIKGILKPLPTLVEISSGAGHEIIARPGARFDLPPDNDLLMLDPKREEIGRLENDDLGVRTPHYDFLDAKARRIDLELRAVSRFASDFPNQTHYRDRAAAESRWLKATLPPAKPEVAFIVPLFEIEVEKADSAIQHRRRGGWFRIWLERPWYSSGEGELLALVCAPSNLFRARGGAASFLTDKLERAWGSITEAAELAKLAPKFRPSEQLQRLYTGWGLDPIWVQPKSKLFFMPPGVFANRLVPDLPKPVVPSQFAGLKDVPRRDLEVALALYKPTYDEAERRWFVDVHVQPDEHAYFPFVRLGLARYQPNAIEGCELSEVVSSEFVQLTPERSATVTFDSHRRLLRVDVVGQAPERLYDPSISGLVPRMVMRVDKAVDKSSHDVRLWEPVMTRNDALEEVELTYQPEARRWRASHEYDLQRDCHYSVYLEEREPILVDANPKALPRDPPLISSRVIYADRISLPTN